MRFTIDGRDGPVIIDATISPDAVLADALSALGLPTHDPQVDGRPTDPSTPVREIGLAGRHLSTGPPTDDGAGPDGPSARGISVMSHRGIDAGRRVTGPDPLVVGRGDRVDARFHVPSLSCRHLELTPHDSGSVTLRDLESANGTRVNGEWVTTPTAVEPGDRVLAGSVEFSVEATGPAANEDPGGNEGPRDPAGRHIHHRPPRQRRPAPHQPIDVPEPRPTVGGRSPFSWALFLAPLAIGLVMAIVFSPLLALLALLSPVVMVASWFENRRRARREERSTGRTRRRDLERFVQALDEAVRLETAARLTADPDLAVVTGVTNGSDRSRLWERRPPDDDLLSVRIGLGPVPWSPPLAAGGTTRPDDELATVIEAGSVLPSAPLTVDLGAGPVTALVGPPEITVPLARAIMCRLAVQCGPADLRLMVVTDHRQRWAWADWLPHHPDDTATDGPSRPRVVAGPADLADLEILPDDERWPVVVVTDCEHPMAAGQPIRDLADRSTSCRVLQLAATTTDVAHRAETVITATGGDGEGAIAQSPHPPRQGVFLDGMAADVAERCARVLAGVVDPEQAGASGWARPHHLLDMTDQPGPSGAVPTPSDVARCWKQADDGLVAVIGSSSAGPVSVDLGRDGPHMLVGGTTGSGKSELLRTLLTSMALTYSPRELNVMLVDFKGGAAFDACARLPHVVGLVTDLDGQLGERAVASLEAELRHRELVLREGGHIDLAAHRAEAPEPLPRLVVIVDEFATLATEEPDVLDALIGVAQRGRSLGLHLILATQRPSGAVNDNIRTNTNLRIALRVLDQSDSADVIGTGAAATISPTTPGRAFIRRGPAPPTEVQVARVDVPYAGASAAPVVIHSGAGRPDGADPSEPTHDLDALVDAMDNAWDVAGGRSPRRPWCDPLPTTLSLDRLDQIESLLDSPVPVGGASRLTIGIADDPGHQGRRLACWDLNRSNLLVYGMPGSGVTTTLRTLGTGLAGAGSPAHHVYVVGDPADYQELGAMAAVGAVVAPADTERINLLIDLIEQPGATGEPLLVLIVDEIADALGSLEDAGGLAASERLIRALAGAGGGRGCRVAIGSSRVASMPPALAGATTQRLVLALADPYDYTLAGARSTDARRWPPGRALDVESGLEVQMGTWSAPEATVGAAPVNAPDPLTVLAPVVRLEDLDRSNIAPTNDRPPALRLGRTVDDGVAALDFDGPPRLLITGPGASGRTTSLAVIASELTRRGSIVLATGARRSTRAILQPWARWVEPADLAAALLDAANGAVLLVDDADLVEDLDGTLAALTAGSAMGIVVATHAERLRRNFAHWAMPLLRQRFGLALRPDPFDAELWCTELDPAPPHWPPGRGVLIEDGRGRVIQTALVGAATATRAPRP